MSRKHNEGLPHITIISPGFNCESHVRYWYNSLRVQSYSNWTAVAIDDASDDNTWINLLKYSEADSRVKPIHNDTHHYQLGNWYECISVLDPNELVIRLDLDDFLGNKYILEQIIKENLYRDARVFTITEFAMSHYFQDNSSQRWYWKEPRELLMATEFGDSLFCFQAKYFQNIPKEHFLDDNGNYFTCSGDVAITGPILYQAWNYKHHLYIDNALMYDDIREPQYNDDNLVDESGQRLQFVVRDILLRRFRKLVLNKTLKLED